MTAQTTAVRYSVTMWSESGFEGSDYGCYRAARRAVKRYRDAAKANGLAEVAGWPVRGQYRVTLTERS
jgi:hypothetical protein